MNVSEASGYVVIKVIGPFKEPLECFVLPAKRSLSDVRKTQQGALESHQGLFPMLPIPVRCSREKQAVRTPLSPAGHA
jgi:hypothetical protein